VGGGGGGECFLGKGWVHLYHRADSAPFFLSCTFQAHEFTVVLELEKGSVSNWGLKSILVEVIEKNVQRW